MTDLEIQRRLRGMNAPRAPGVDLWPAIEQRIAAPSSLPASRRPPRRWLPFALAAALPLGLLGAGLLTSHLHSAATSKPVALEQDAPRDRPRALDDPRLAGAAIVLDAAQIELRQAIQQNPDAGFLVELLNRTEARRNRLDRYGTTAS